MTRRQLAVSFIVGALVSGLALYYAFRNIPLADLAHYLGTVDYWWILPSLALMVLSFILRVFRYQIIVSSVTRLSFWEAFHPMVIGFFMNCVLPARVGELARPVLISKQHNTTFFGIAATVAAERALDLMALLAFFVLVLVTVPIDPDLEMKFGETVLNKAQLESIANKMVWMILILLAGMVAVSINASRKFMEKIVLGFPGLMFFLNKGAREKVRQVVCDRIVGIMERFAEGFELLKSPGKLVSSILLSLVLWLAVAYSYVVFAYGFPGIRLTFLEWTAVMVIICLFISLPSVPGFWGLWEAGGLFALALFSIPETEAMGYILVNHAIQMLPVMLTGIVSTIITGVSIWQVAGQAETEEQVPAGACETRE